MSTGSKQRPFIRTKGGSLACVHPTRRKSAKAQNKAEAAGHHMAPPRHADSLAPDYGQGRPLRLRAGGRPRLATAPHSRGPARGALRFSGPVLGRRPSALFALGGRLAVRQECLISWVATSGERQSETW